MSPGSQLLLDGEDISELVGDAAGAGRARAARSSRSSCSRTRPCSTTCAPPRDPRDIGSYVRDLVWPVNVPLPDTVLSDDPRVRTRGRPRPPGRGPALRPPAAAGDGAGGRDPVRACCCSTSPRPASATPRPPSSRTWSAGWPKEWGIAVLLVEHDMNFVMSVCDELVVLDFGRQIADGKPADGPQRPGRDRRLPRRGGGRGAPAPAPSTGAAERSRRARRTRR